MFLSSLFLYLGAFFLIWLGAGLIVSSADRFSKKLKLSSFALSFFVLGLLTSIPEFAVGLTSISQHDPEIFVGNLLGGIPVIFLLIIPLLAIFGNGIKLHHQLEGKSLIFTLFVIALPSFLVIDKKVTNPEGLLLIILYFLLFYVIEKKKGLLDKIHTHVLEKKDYSYKDILKVLLGIIVVFLASQIIVDKTLYFSEIFKISPFYISIIILSIGTNLPELSLAVRSVISGKKDIAFGDYIGSAAGNTLLFGIFTIINEGEVLTANNFLNPFIFISIGLGLFYYFARTNFISRKAGIIMIIFYILFAFLELSKG